MRLSLLLIVCLFITSCGKHYNNSPEGYAAKFCDCSEELAKAVVKQKASRISEEEFQKIKAAQIACMGEQNPLENLSEEDKLQFQARFLKELFEKCPNTARNYGYKE